MRVRRRSPNSKPREKRTLIPAFDPQELAKEIEREVNRATLAPPFDPSSYARIVDGAPVLLPPAEPADPSEAKTQPPVSQAVRREDTLDLDDPVAVGREMYGCYLASDFPAALVLAERVLAAEPDHALAQLVADRCRERLAPSAGTLRPSSVLRLKMAELERHMLEIDPTSSVVLGHIDGISDAATEAALTGLPSAEALDRLHALLDMGVVEVVSF